MAYTVLALVLLLCSCGQSSSIEREKNNTPTWQERYDLGVRYLSEGNYQEAIIAFTEAIEIDPKQTPAYVGRGDAYIDSGATMENFDLAQTDFEKAPELDETLVDAYLKLADIYADGNDCDKVLKLLQRGLDKTSNSLIEAQYIKVLSETDCFVADPAFAPFSKLDLKLQDLIETAMVEISEDPESTAKLIIDNYNDLMEKGVAPESLRTMKANYKIQMRYEIY